MAISPRPLNRLEALKGIAIVIFMFYHFRVLVWGDDPAAWAYGRAAVGMFFIISGYGLSHSLSKRLAAGRPLVSTVLTFWRDRAVRLFPQYWSAVALTYLVYGIAYSWWQVLGVDSPYWFISQILQCYLCAPLLHVLSRSRHLAVRLLPLGVFAGANALAYGLLGGVTNTGWQKHLEYQGLLLTHVVLFYLAMLWAKPIAGHKRDAATAPQASGSSGPCGYRIGCGGPFAGVLLVAGYTAMMVVCTRSAVVWLNIASTLSFMGASFVMFAGFLRLERVFPGCGILAFLGKYSLSIYLFEPFFYYVLFRWRRVEVGNVKSIHRYLIMLPLFFGACAIVQSIQNAALKRMCRKC